MGSKKHKKESKKKKHRSRSRSPLDGEHRERKKHKKHKDRKKDRSPDIEEVPVDSHLLKPEGNGEADYSYAQSPSYSAERETSKERDRRARGDRRHHRHKNHELESDRSHSRHRAVSPVASGSRGDSNSSPAEGGAQDSLSIEETNRLRAKLGLKPLEVSDQPPADDGKLKDDLGEFYHAPAANLAAQKKQEKLRDKLDERKEKRKIEQKLQKTTTLGAGSDDEDAAAWVKRSRELQQQRAEAEKRAAMLDEMDAVFGVSALIAEEEPQPQRHYGARALQGLRVAHDIDMIGEERETVLTLADKDVLADDAEDVLVNVNLLDEERYKKNIQDRKKARTGYQAYDDEADLEAAALGLPRNVLSKYDEELNKDKAAKDKGFVIGDDSVLEAKRFRDMMERLQGGVNKRLESLRLPDLQLATEYMNEKEIEAKFKKPKKKGKMRRRPKNEPIDVDDYDAGGAPLLTDDTEVEPQSGMAAAAAELPVDEDEVEVDSELQMALARARRTRYKEQLHNLPKVEEILESVKEEPVKEEPIEEGTMVLDATAEFCRTLGDIPTYGQAGNRDSRVDIMELENDDLEADLEPTPSSSGAWSRVDVNNEKPPDLVQGGPGVLGAEPRLGAGAAGALQLALSKGYLERPGATPQPRPASAHLLHAKHYSIEDKTYGDDDKHGRRERGGYSGPLTEFKEKSSFRPNIKLEYVDDDGRPLCPKEAFRYLSHKFHGKGPGKNKQEKRLKKAVQEGLMKKMSSTDTPLNTLQMLQEKQRETHSPFIVLSGAKRDAAH